MKDVLIIGSDGKLGSGLMKKLETRAHGTSRRPHILTSEIYLDLLNQESIEKLEKVSYYKYAIIVAAISEPDQCYLDQKLSLTINVESTIKVLKILKKKSIKPIFISTEMVFDGNKGNYSEVDKPDPILIYGKQKLEVEKFIQNHFHDFMILRLPKIYSSQNNDRSILNSFYCDIVSNKECVYAKDQYFSPTLQDDFELSVSKVIEKDLSGIFHLSSSCRVSRWDFFEMFANKVGNFGRIKQGLLSDISFLENRPNDLSLNGEKLSKALDLVFATPRAGIDKWMNDNPAYLSNLVGHHEKF